MTDFYRQTCVLLFIWCMYELHRNPLKYKIVGENRALRLFTTVSFIHLFIHGSINFQSLTPAKCDNQQLHTKMHKIMQICNSFLCFMESFIFAIFLCWKVKIYKSRWNCDSYIICPRGQFSNLVDQISSWRLDNFVHKVCIWQWLEEFITKKARYTICESLAMIYIIKYTCCSFLWYFFKHRGSVSSIKQCWKSKIRPYSLFF